MDDMDEFDHLIGTLYEAATEPNRWPEALALCADFVGASGAHLLTVDKSNGWVREEIYGGSHISQQDLATWVQQHLPQDPRLTAGMMANMGLQEWRFCHAFLDNGFVARDAFYQEFLIPIGIRYTMGGLIDETDEHKVILGVFRPPNQPYFDNAERKAAERFGHHLGRAYRLYQQFRELNAKAETGTNAVHAMPWALLIVDGDARVLQLNAAAEGLLKADGGHLICRSSRLGSVDPGNESTLAALIAQATASPALGGAMVMIGAKPWQVSVTPLPAASAIVHDWQRPLALVVVTQSGGSISSCLPVDVAGFSPIALREASAYLAQRSPEEVAQAATGQFALTYRLTRCETKVLQGLMDGYSLKEIAERHCVSRNTIRSQLASLMQKTDCRRQKDLIRLFLRGNLYAVGCGK